MNFFLCNFEQPHETMKVQREAPPQIPEGVPLEHFFVLKCEIHPGTELQPFQQSIRAMEVLKSRSFERICLDRAPFPTFLRTTNEGQKHVQAFNSQRQKLKAETWETVDFHTLLNSLITPRTAVKIRTQETSRRSKEEKKGKSVCPCRRLSAA